jgi:predicted PurR-regulated permease PerM
VRQVDLLIRPNATKANSAAASSKLLTLITVVVVVVSLYFGRQVLIPFAFALVLAFLLTPIVDWLQKRGLGRVPAVFTVFLLTGALAGSIGWIVTGQLMDIIDQYPSYQANLHSKIQSLRVPNRTRLTNATNTVAELSNELSLASESAVDKRAAKGSGARPIAVRVAQPPSNARQYLHAIVGPLTGVFETSAMVIVFTLFMLVKREDLRNRLIRLAGQTHLTVVTQALDDASRRLNRYLMLQFLVNVNYGLIFGVASYLIGIPHALLWGALAGLLRFVPYLGTPIAAAFPIGMALAVYPGWHQAALILVVFVVLEIIVGNFVEPWLYGTHTGISSLAVLVAAVFWAILWGPVGLILSTPLTVCLALMGRYVPPLSLFEVLLGDEAVLPVEAHFYQRLLALDQDEARGIANAYLKDKPLESFYDSVLIPTLVLAEQDRHLDSRDTKTASFINQSIRELIEDLGEYSADDSVADMAAAAVQLTSLRVVCIPARDEADELVAMMIEQLATRLGCEVEQRPESGSAKIMEQVCSRATEVAVISALPPFAAGKARSLCKTLRQRCPDTTVILGLWGTEENAAQAQDRIGPVCTGVVAATLHGAIALLGERKHAAEPLPSNLTNSSAEVI